MNLLYIIFISFSFTSSSKVAMKGSIIDLSYNLNNEYTPTYPLHTKFKSKVVMDGVLADPESDFDGFYSKDFTMAEHAGTHFDAPIHIGKSLQSVDNIPLENLYKIPGIMIDVSLQAILNPNYAVQIKDIEDWIEDNGDIPDGSIIIFTTGWGKKAMDKDSYFGFDDNGKMNYPGLSPEVAQWIVDYKNTSDSLVQGIIAIAIDAVGFDVPNIPSFPAHRILLTAGILGIENAANTDKLPPKDFTVTMLPLKMAGGTGSPIRLMAEINDIPRTAIAYSSAQILIPYSASMSMLLMFMCAFLLV